MAKKPTKKKSTRAAEDSKRKAKTNRIKAVLLLGVALFFFVYMIYAGGSVASFFSLVIGLVCGSIGVLYLRGAPGGRKH